MKRFLVLLMVVLMVVIMLFSLAACGDNASHNSTASTTESKMIDTGDDGYNTTTTQGIENDTTQETNNEGGNGVPPTFTDSGAQDDSKPSPTTKPNTPTTSTKPTETPTNNSKEENLITSISPSATSYNLTIGESKTIGYIIAPSNSTEKIKWESENKNVVTVDNGTIKAIGIGQTFVKASASKAGFSVSVTVTNKKVAISSFDFKQSQFRLAIGESTIVPTNITPSNATEKLVWSSSDPKVATVTDGKITAVGKGNTFISASSEKCGSIACSVEVYAPVTNIVFDQSVYTLPRHEAITIGVTLTPSSASQYRLIWTSSNPNVATVTNTGFVRGVSNGISTITVTSEEGGFSKQCTVSVVDPPLNIGTGRLDDYDDRHLGPNQIGIEASIVVTGGSGNYENFKFNIKLYCNNNLVLSSDNAKITYSKTSCTAFLKWQTKQWGQYKAIFTVTDDNGTVYTKEASFLFDWGVTPSPS